VFRFSPTFLFAFMLYVTSVMGTAVAKPFQSSLETKNTYACAEKKHGPEHFSLS
jgi:hypothetical protein